MSRPWTFLKLFSLSIAAFSPIRLPWRPALQSNKKSVRSSGSSRMCGLILATKWYGSAPFNDENTINKRNILIPQIKIRFIPRLLILLSFFANLELLILNVDCSSNVRIMWTLWYKYYRSEVKIDKTQWLANLAQKKSSICPLSPFLPFKFSGSRSRIKVHEQRYSSSFLKRFCGFWIFLEQSFRTHIASNITTSNKINQFYHIRRY